jgi:phage shock protein E
MSEKVYQDIAAEELSQTFAREKERFVVVDVRTDEEFQSGHIPGAIHIPHDEMEERAHELESVKDRNILLVCRSGRRSVIAAHVLADKGFRRLFNLEGGMLEWTGPVTTE